MTIQKILLGTSLVLMGAGAALVAPFGMSIVQQRQVVALSPMVVTQSEMVTPVLPKEVIQGVPRSIKVPSLGIDVTIEDGYYDAATGQWTITEEAAFFATPTLPVNTEGGNTLIYGHNSKKIFGKLLDIKPGAKAIVTTKNGYEFTYTFTTSEAVIPTDVSSLDYDGRPRLTLQTCSGIWNETRQMVYFELKDYRKR